MQKLNIKKYSHYLIFSGLFLLYAISNYRWLLENKLSVSYDEGIHLWTGLRFAKAFINPTHGVLYELFHANTTHWPPLFHFTAGIFNAIFGTAHVVSVMTNMLFFLLLLVSLYLIGKKVSGTYAGIMATVMVSFYPIIYGHSRLFLLDFALTALVSFSVYCLISTENFKNLRWSIMFGIAVVMGMLTKWSYVIFILPLFLYVATISLCGKNGKEALVRTKRILIGGLSIGLMGYILCTDKDMLLLRYLKSALDTHDFGFVQGMQWFVLALSNNMLSFFFFILFIVCLGLFYIKSNSEQKTFITIWYLIPIVALSFIKWKQPRFFLPVLPCFALMSAVGLDAIKNRKIKDVALVVIFIVGLAQFFNISFNQDINTRIDFFPYKIRDFRLIYKPYMASTDYEIVAAAPSLKTGWAHTAIAKSIASYTSKLREHPLIVGTIYSEKNMHFETLFSSGVMKYYMQRELMESNIVLSNSLAVTFYTREFSERISDMQAIVYISKNNRWPSLKEMDSFFKGNARFINDPWYNSTEDNRFSNLISHKEGFELVDRIELPEGYYANIYIYNIPQIEKGSTLIKIFNGKAKIFYKGKEITEGIGISHAFVHEDITYSYKDAVWDYNVISPYKVSMVGKWHRLGISQWITVSMDPDMQDVIEIKTEMTSRNDLSLDDCYVNGSFSSDYKYYTWPFYMDKTRLGDIGMFSPVFDVLQPEPKYEDYEVFGFYENVEKDLPALLFKFLDTGFPFSTGISNTDYHDNARCIYGSLYCHPLKIEISAGRVEQIMNIQISLLDKLAPEITMEKIEQRPIFHE